MNNTYDVEKMNLFIHQIKKENKAFDDYKASLGYEGEVPEIILNAWSAGKCWERYHQWNSCEGDILPPYGESVIVRLVDRESGEYRGETFMHRSNNKEVVRDDNNWCIIIPEFKHTHWCFVPKFEE